MLRRMTRVDFYVLASHTPEAGNPLPVICRLCDKATAGGHNIYVYAPEAPTADALDGMLWSFRQGSFITHERSTGGSAPEPPPPAVLIGADAPPDGYQQVMINLGAEVPPFFSRFERVLELVHGDDTERARSRARYKFYRDRGYALATHDLSSPAGVG